MNTPAMIVLVELRLMLCAAVSFPLLRAARSSCRLLCEICNLASQALLSGTTTSRVCSTNLGNSGDGDGFSFGFAMSP